MVFVRVGLGDVYANQWWLLADVARKFAGSRARIDQQQNIVCRWVLNESLYDIYQALGTIGFRAPLQNLQRTLPVWTIRWHEGGNWLHTSGMVKMRFQMNNLSTIDDS